jgi:hypothetical protein
MIDVYAWATMNARKIYIMLEKTGLPYRIRPKYLAGDFLTKLTYSSRCGHDARAGIKSSKITYQLCLTDPTLALGLLRIPDQKRRQHQRHQNKHRDLEGTVVDCRTGHAKVRDRLHNHAK